MQTVKIYTDGGCRGNPGIGGWAALLQMGKHQKTIKGNAKDTTNNRMELTAAIKALQALTKPCKVILTTDSQYVKNGISLWIDNWKKNNWKTAAKKPVKNQDLWLELDKSIEKHSIEWAWVKGHSGHKENDIVDDLANQAMDELIP